MKILAVDKTHLNTLWPYILRYIQEPLEHEAGDLTPQSIYDSICDGRYLLLVVYDEDQQIYLAAQTMEVIDSPRGRWANLITTGGKQLDTWEAALENTIEKLAIEQGCKSVCTRGRLGWFKRLKKYGYEPLYFIAQKKLGDANVCL